jgi:hypothetical protein
MSLSQLQQQQLRQIQQQLQLCCAQPLHCCQQLLQQRQRCLPYACQGTCCSHCQQQQHHCEILQHCCDY